MRIGMAVLVSACSAGLIIGACDGSASRSSSSRSMTTVTVDRASFLDRVNQICQESSDEVKRIVAPGDQTNVTEEQLPAWSAYFQQILPPIEKEQTELRALTPPSGDAGAFNAILDDQAAGIDDLQALQRAAAQSDLPAFQAAMTEFNQHFAMVSAGARQFGLDRCSD